MAGARVPLPRPPQENRETANRLVEVHKWDNAIMLKSRLRHLAIGFDQWVRAIG